MARLRRTDFTAAFLRTFGIQGSWNYRTLLGGGLGYALIPLLSRIHAGDPVAFRRSLERHTSSFNGHPYLCSVAVGALARLENDEVEAERIDRFRTALMGPLGAIGDRLVWSAWRPLCLLLTIGAFGAGLGPLQACLVFLIIYNAGHVALRLWGYRQGWEAGMEVGRVLAHPLLQRTPELLGPACLLLLGFAVAVLVSRLPGIGELGVAGAPIAASAAVLTYLFPDKVGSGAALLLGAGAVAWWL
ncbi:MAG: PTS system mannose/fructose/sorbose family transporter subunit IID [Gemmatimonadota bacterium]